MISSLVVSSFGWFDGPLKICGTTPTFNIFHTAEHLKQNAYVRSAPSVMSFRKQLKTYYFGHFSRPPDGYVISCPDLL